jgi:hypothetical protein
MSSKEDYDTSMLVRWNMAGIGRSAGIYQRKTALALANRKGVIFHYKSTPQSEQEQNES